MNIHFGTTPLSSDAIPGACVCHDTPQDSAQAALQLHVCMCDLASVEMNYLSIQIIPVS